MDKSIRMSEYKRPTTHKSYCKEACLFMKNASMPSMVHAWLLVLGTLKQEGSQVAGPSRMLFQRGKSHKTKWSQNKKTISFINRRNERSMYSGQNLRFSTDRQLSVSWFY